jgi:hypothetical protein
MLQSAVETLQSRLAPDHPHLAFARANLESALLYLEGTGRRRSEVLFKSEHTDKVTER